MKQQHSVRPCEHIKAADTGDDHDDNSKKNVMIAIRRFGSENDDKDDDGRFKVYIAEKKEEKEALLCREGFFSIFFFSFFSPSQNNFLKRLRKNIGWKLLLFLSLFLFFSGGIFKKEREMK